MSNNLYSYNFPTYPEVLTAKHIAEILGLGYVKALRLIKYSDMKYIKIGNAYRIPKKFFLEWLYSKETREIELDD